MKSSVPGGGRSSLPHPGCSMLGMHHAKIVATRDETMKVCLSKIKNPKKYSQGQGLKHDWKLQVIRS